MSIYFLIYFISVLVILVHQVKINENKKCWLGLEYIYIIIIIYIFLSNYIGFDGFSSL